ncbi:GDSL-type esterase/lipase family protein [uncultured Phycicoccus sp.]|uniref:SGNH/GDSL hydrolase family protein n=1 Tax=uncultured Phycicoccus sp. TaxID=661422 RepID=UPI0026258E4B|nr:GDSL-type esterase/lipase family protein [uncultured Phycicoccus sp.]
MRRPLLLSVLAAALVLAGCGGADEAAAPAAPAASAPAPSASPTEAPSDPAEDPLGRTYLALGDSLAAGYQPGGTELRDSAYPALALSRLDRAGAELTLENLACSGETTDSFLDGGKCDYAAGSQMAQAEAVLAERAGDVALVSIDLGGNDLLRCVRETAVDTACTKQGLAGVAENLPEILDRLRAAAGQDVPVLVLGYYNPWLAASYLGEGEGQLDAATSAYTALDRAITKAATEAGATPVPLTSAFKLDDATPTTFGGREVPTNVAQVCTLTYICTAFDIHLTDEGAAVVGRVLAAAATKAGVT